MPCRRPHPLRTLLFTLSTRNARSTQSGIDFDSTAAQAGTNGHPRAVLATVGIVGLAILGGAS